MVYLTLKFLHVLAAIIVLGTGLGSAWYMWMAGRRRDLAGICFASRHVVIADWLFTTPAIVVQLVTGIWLVHAGAYSFTDTWILLGLLLYCFAGACWVPVVWLQIRMRDMAMAALRDGQALPERYWRLQRIWTRLGCLAFPAVLTVVWLMVFKPR